jgi:cysteine desulfurase
VSTCPQCTKSCASQSSGCRCSRTINFDNNDIMPMLPIVRRQIVEQMEATHLCCKTAEEAVSEVCQLFGEEAPVVFTSGGTENAALISSGTRFPERNRIVGSLLDPLCMLTQPGMEIIGIDDHAYVEAEVLRQVLMNSGFAAVSLTLVNGEYGIVSPVAALAKLAKVMDPEVFVYVDASQACGRMALHNIPPEVDAVGISGSKIGALPGTGALWIRDPSRLETLMGGGYQQYGVREGSLNTMGISALGTVLKRSRQRLDEDCAQISSLRRRLDEMILNIGGIRLNFEDKALVCNTSNYYIEDIDSRKLCLALKRLGLKVSESVSGLQNINTITPLTASLALEPFRNLRFSLSVHNTTRELEHAYRLVSGAIELFRNHKLGTEHVFSI